MAAKDIRTLLEQFLDHLEIEKNRSLRTRTNYQFYLGRFLDWARSRRKGKDVAPADIDDELVREFRLWLNRVENGRGEELKKNTQNYHLIALRAFLKYLAKRDVRTMAAEKVELGKMPERMVAFLEPTDLERLLAAPLSGAGDKPDVIRLRDKAVLELLFSTGLRVSELAGLNREDVNLERDEFTVRGKGRKLRVVFLSEQAKYWIKQYLAGRRDVSPFLFVAHDRARKGREDADASGLTPRSVERIVARYSRAAGIPKHITPHSLRHTFATDLLMNGADIRSVQTLLGHASITTTQIYTHVTNQQLHDVHKAFHGSRRKRGKG